MMNPSMFEGKCDVNAVSSSLWRSVSRWVRRGRLRPGRKGSPYFLQTAFWKVRFVYVIQKPTYKNAPGSTISKRLIG